MHNEDRDKNKNNSRLNKEGGYQKIILKNDMYKKKQLSFENILEIELNLNM